MKSLGSSSDVTTFQETILVTLRRACWKAWESRTKVPEEERKMWVREGVIADLMTIRVVNAIRTRKLHPFEAGLG
jgi:hypothetical protein